MPRRRSGPGRPLRTRQLGSTTPDPSVHNMTSGRYFDFEVQRQQLLERAPTSDDAASGSRHACGTSVTTADAVGSSASPAAAIVAASSCSRATTPRSNRSKSTHSLASASMTRRSALSKNRGDAAAVTRLTCAGSSETSVTGKYRPTWSTLGATSPITGAGPQAPAAHAKRHDGARQVDVEPARAERVAAGRQALPQPASHASTNASETRRRRKSP